VKRFLIFGYDQYYPAGGLHDLVAAAETLEEAMRLLDVPCAGYPGQQERFWAPPTKSDFVEVVDVNHESGKPTIVWTSDPEGTRERL
jgi:hypothetical protein